MGSSKDGTPYLGAVRDHKGIQRVDIVVVVAAATAACSRWLGLWRVCERDTAASQPDELVSFGRSWAERSTQGDVPVPIIEQPARRTLLRSPKRPLLSAPS